MSLTLSAVWFQYTHRGPHILRGASLDVPRGQSCALMAPSGEGKSTLLSIAAGMLSPTEGAVEIATDDGSPNTTGSGARSVTWMFQGPAVLTRRTAADNVALPLVAQGRPRAEARGLAVEALGQVGLAAHAGDQVRHLSGGQAQRVAIARALVTRPEVVLADEPTASLDFDTASSVCAALLDAMSGAAVVLATHDIRIARLADRIVRLDHGVLVEDAT